MAKRKGPSTSRPRARDKAAKEGSDAKRAFENECAQLRRDISALEAKQGKLEEQLGPLRREEEQVQQSLLTKIKRLTEVENAQRLGKLPQKVWEKVLDELDENDLFPLALSCRFFRQKQKELVARLRESGPESGKPRLALKTTLRYRPVHCPPASAEYLQFLQNCEIQRGEYVDDSEWEVRAESEYEYVEFSCPTHLEALFVKDKCIRPVAAYHGHIPLLQELLEESREKYPEELAQSAGESFSLRFSSSLWLLTCFSLSLLRSARRPTGDLAVAANPRALVPRQ